MINYKTIKLIENCTGLSLNSLDKVLKLGFLIYSDGIDIHVLDSITFYEYSNTEIKGYDIIEITNKYFYIVDSKLFEINFTNLSVKLKYSSKEEALYPFSDNIISEGSSNWRAKTQHFSIVKFPNQVLFSWKDGRELICILGDVSCFYLIETEEIFATDLHTEKMRWKLPFGGGISGRRYYQVLSHEKCIFQKKINSGNNLVNLDFNSGKIVWELEQTHHFYNYDDRNRRLIGLGFNYNNMDRICSNFEIINIITGKREVQHELNLQIPAHLTYYADGYLYFSGYKSDNISPIFGAVDVETGEIAFTQTIETPHGEVYRGCYDRPVVVGKRLYIRDQNKTLHIYERE